MSKHSRIDPEPFGVAVGVAGIVGGLAGAVSLYRDFSRTWFRKSHRATVSTLRGITRTLAEIEEHLGELKRLSDEAIPLETQSIWLGSRVLMVPVQFSEYARHADRVLMLLRHVQKAAHRLERHAVGIPYVQQETTRDMIDLNLRIEDLLRERHRAPADVIQNARMIVERTRQFVNQLLAELGGQPPEDAPS